MAANAKRYRLSVPEEDAAVAEWLENQLNYSLSIRLLIRQDIMRHGTSDVTCRDVQQTVKKAKPQKQSAAAVTQQPAVYHTPAPVIPTSVSKATESAPVPVTMPAMASVYAAVDDEGDDPGGMLESLLG